MDFSFSSFIPNASSISSFINILFWGGLVTVVFVVAGIMIYRKVKYQYYGEIYKRRQGIGGEGIPSAVIVRGKAGYFTKKTGKTVFRIKWGELPWKKIELSKLPDPDHMIGNKVVYLQLNKDNLIQAKVSIDWNGVFKLEPVEDDLKYGAQLSMEENTKILDQKRMSPVVVGMVVMGLILISGIVVFYFLTKG